MVSSSQLVAFAALTFVMIVIPGPSVLFTVSRALTVGRRDALLTVLGNATGVYLQVVAVAFGLGAVVAQSATVFTIVKFCGAAYLVYLGAQAWRHRHSLADALHRNTPARTTHLLRVLRDGLLVGLTNPKSVVFLAAVLPQFVHYDAGAIPAQVMILGILLPVIAVLTDSVWAFAAATVRDWFVRSPHRLSHIGGAGGLTMIGLGITVAFTGRKD